MAYIPHTDQDIREMLEKIGCDSLENFFKDIPEELRLKKKYDIPQALTEPELLAWMEKLSNKNSNADNFINLMGAGCYEHFIPLLVDYLSGRSEFWTSYTPYQPEASQGNLQAIFEFQTVICELTGMEVANASMYDGATAMTEVMLLAYFHCRRKKNTILISPALHPEYAQVAETYMKSLNISLQTLPEKDGVIDVEKITEYINEDVAAIVVANPNFYGLIEDIEPVITMARDAKIMSIVVTNPISLGLLEAPGHYGADIVVGDGQPLGIPMGYGGPSFGIFATRQKYIRKVPGRIVGETVDLDGKRGFVLTLQTREQHIRREKATSNICTNQALMALRSLLYLVSLGKEGFYQVAYQSLQKSHYLAKAIAELPGFSLRYSSAFFNEFVVQCPVPAKQALEKLRQYDIFGGVVLNAWFSDREHDLLVAVTECRSRQELDRMVEVLKSNFA